MSPECFQTQEETYWLAIETIYHSENTHTNTIKRPKQTIKTKPDIVYTIFKLWILSLNVPLIVYWVWKTNLHCDD